MTELLCDSDFLLSLVINDEPTHEKAKTLAQFHDSQGWHVLDLVVHECVSVASRKYDQRTARQLYSMLTAGDLTHHNIKHLEAKAWDEFFSYKKKNISVIDCANLVTARKYGWKIASFDAFYPQTIRI